MKRFLLFSFLLILIVIAASASWYASRLHHNGNGYPKDDNHVSLNKLVEQKLLRISGPAKQYAAAKGFNTQFCFLVDMSMPSGENRFFVYDFARDSVLAMGLVTHGRCNQNWLSGRKYGNVIGCGCTSLGRYKVGNAYQGRFGLAYKLHGLDTSNSNAYNRFVVLHSHSCVPANEVDPYPICQSDGCPTVAPAFLQNLSQRINSSDQPVLLWIFE